MKSEFPKYIVVDFTAMKQRVVIIGTLCKVNNRANYRFNSDDTRLFFSEKHSLKTFEQMQKAVDKIITSLIPVTSAVKYTFIHNDQDLNQYIGDNFEHFV